MNEERCPECGKENSLVVKNYEGTVVCKNCALVDKMSIID